MCLENSNERTSNVSNSDTRQRKMYSRTDLFQKTLLLASSPLVSSPKLFFQCEILFKVWSCKYYKNNLSVVVIHSKSDFSTVNWVAESEEIHEVYSTEILLNTAKRRETQDCMFILQCWASNQTISHNFKTLNGSSLQYSGFPCHLKVDIEINSHWFYHQWKCDKGKKIDDYH